MAYILHLETSTKSCSAALSFNGSLIACKEQTDEGYAHGEKLTLFIQDVLKEAAIEPKNLSAISVAAGPGSYTGLRIGVSTAKGLCYALNIPLIAIDSLLALTELMLGKYPGKNLCPLIDARRMEVYNAVYDASGKQIKPISADIIDHESYAEYEPFVYFGDGAAKLQEIWKDKNCEADLSVESSAVGQIRPAYEKFIKGEFEDTAYYEPFYLKEFAAGKP